MSMSHRVEVHRLVLERLEHVRATRIALRLPRRCVRRPEHLAPRPLVVERPDLAHVVQLDAPEVVFEAVRRDHQRVGAGRRRGEQRQGAVAERRHALHLDQQQRRVVLPHHLRRRGPPVRAQHRHRRPVFLPQHRRHVVPHPAERVEHDEAFRLARDGRRNAGLRRLQRLAAGIFDPPVRLARVVVHLVDRRAGQDVVELVQQDRLPPLAQRVRRVRALACERIRQAAEPFRIVVQDLGEPVLALV
jgi:hypothetical protein